MSTCCICKKNIGLLTREFDCVICGKQYVRHLIGIENADEIDRNFYQIAKDEMIVLERNPQMNINDFI